jgi:hypothetical protein
MLARNYKESPVEETIHKLKHILETYKILPKELYVFHPYPELYSSRISLPEELGGFATNGKGRTEDFCRAKSSDSITTRERNSCPMKSFVSFPKE